MLQLRNKKQICMTIEEKFKAYYDWERPLQKEDFLSFIDWFEKEHSLHEIVMPSYNKKEIFFANFENFPESIHLSKKQCFLFLQLLLSCEKHAPTKHTFSKMFYAIHLFLAETDIPISIYEKKTLKIIFQECKKI